MSSWFFQGWDDVVRIVTVGSAAYFALVALLRISGKRTLSKLNAFDLVVTVAIGSVLSTVLLSPDISLVEGIGALALLVALQYSVAWSARRSALVHRLVRAEPTLLARRGELIESAMKAERIAADEVAAATRAAGCNDVSDAEAVVLEADGSLSVIT